MPRRRRFLSRTGRVIFIAAFGFALLSARDYAGSWNDGSRLAAVESLIDYHTWVIDRSIFVAVPHHPGASPYGNNALLNATGTRDVALIDGKIYSAKPPISILLRAGIYAAAQFIFGLKASRNPRMFCYLMTVSSSGLAYAIAVWGIFQIGLRMELGRMRALLLAASLGLATVSIAYVQAVNDHIVELAMAAAVIVNMLGLLDAQCEGRSLSPMVLAVGALSGFGYALEQGSGTILLVATTVWAAYRTRSTRSMALFVMAAAPWIIAHHIVLYAVAATLRPLASVGAYVAFPGSAFTAADMAGVWSHRSFLKTLGYAIGMLLGPRGFVGYNLALFLSLAAICRLIAQGDEQTSEIIFVGCYAGGTWLLYSLFSSNYSGWCCSIRWFVPLLAPGYYVLARFLKEHPDYWSDFLILSGWGLLLGARIWWLGPWEANFGFYLVPLQTAALISWAAYRLPRSGFGPIQQLADSIGSPCDE